MLYLYLDESGDLGFDFFGKRPSDHFTVTVLAVRGHDNNRRLIKGTKKTRRKYLAYQQRNELKGSKDSITVKECLFEQTKDVPFNLYALTLNKKRVYGRLTKHKDKVYNYIARHVLQEIPLDEATTRVMLIVDRSKSKDEVKDFNQYMFDELRLMIKANVPLDIEHYESTANLGLQAVDMFSWGVFRKYEKKDVEWYNIFRSKVVFDDLYLP
ncbi:MAG: DUF3800 domain-containing protein [Candidatus Paceibacterota bacterium]